MRFILASLLIIASGCSNSSQSGKTSSNDDAQLTLIGSWTTRDKTRFLEITKGGSIVINKKDSSDDEVGFYELDGSQIRIFKDKQTSEGRTEVSRFEIISENEVVFGQNQEYWNVVNIAGRWYREGTDIKKVIAKQEYDKLTPEEQKLADIKTQKKKCEELILNLKTDKESFLIKLSRLDEEKQADSWKLNASMLAKTKTRLRDADYELKKLKRAVEALEALIADQKRASDIKSAGLDDEGLKELLLSIGETESKLPIEDESEFALKNMVDEELKEFKARKEKK